MSGNQTSASSQSVTTGNWLDETINGMQYKVLLPANYDPSVKYPVMLYLHQLDMGNYPSGLLDEVNPWFNSVAFRTDHPTIVVMPLLDQTADPSGQTINWGGVSTADSAGETNALAALKQVMSQYAVDTSRVYVTGNSMGGIGTEDMLIKYNAYTGTEGKIFAAGLSLAGADYGQGYPQPNQSVVNGLKNVPFWAIHGGQDTTVPLTWDQNLYAAEQAIGGKMIYTQNDSLSHDVWDTYYPQTGANSPLGWLFSQSTGGTVSQTPTPTATPSPLQSANDTVVTGTTSAIIDAAGNRWTITSAGQIAVNGTTDATTANVVELAYVNGTVWQENASNLWWGKTSPTASWSPNAGTSTSPLPAPSPTPTPTPKPTASPNDTVVKAGSSSAIVDASGNKWTITSGGQIAVNGTTDATTANVTELAYVNGTVWQENASNLWWGKTSPAASWSPNAGTSTSPLPAPSPTPTPTPKPTASPNDTVVKAGSSSAIVDASGNKWTITSAGQIAVNGTTDATTANVVGLAYVNGTVWQENASNLWWGKTNPTASWSPNAGTSTSPLPAASSPTPTPVPSTASAATRDPAQVPFASNSVFNLPIGSSAQWTFNAQLASANVYVNTKLSGWNQNIYASTASDPLVTITDTGAIDGTPQTFHVHIPAGAVPANGTDNTFSVDDASTHTWYSFGGFQWTGTNTATVSQGSGESDYGSGLQVANSNWDEGVGTLRESDLQAGSINHMLRMELPTDMLMSYSNSVTQLAPYAWPQTQEDGFAINGNGGTPYSGTIPYGVTIGIPANAVEPADVQANAGANMLWNALRTHGAMIRDSGGSGDTVIFQADQLVDGNDPLILGMEKYGAEIMAQAQILSNQGPNSVNGGGTPIVPLSPEPSDAPAPSGSAASVTPSASNTVVLAGSSAGITDAAGNVWTITLGGQVAVNGSTDGTTANVTELATVNGTVWQENASNLWWGKTSPTAAWSPTPGTSTSPLPSAGTITQSVTGTTIGASQVSVSLAASSKMLFVSGSGDTVSVTGGAQSVTDTGHGNTYVVPAGGKGALSFAGNVLAQSDVLDLRSALAGTSWNGSTSTLSSYLSVATSGGAAVLSVAATPGGSAMAIATISGAGGTTLSGLLAHAIT